MKKMKIFILFMVICFLGSTSLNAANYLEGVMPDAELRKEIMYSIQNQYANYSLTEDDVTEEMLTNLENAIISVQVTGNTYDDIKYDIKSFKGVELIKSIDNLRFLGISKKLMAETDLSYFKDVPVRMLDTNGNFDIVDLSEYFNDFYLTNNYVVNGSGQVDMMYNETDIVINLNEDNYKEFSIPFEEFQFKYINGENAKIAYLPDSLKYYYDDVNYIEYNVKLENNNLVFTIVDENFNYQNVLNKSCEKPDSKPIFVDPYYSYYERLNEAGCGTDSYDSLNIITVSFESKEIKDGSGAIIGMWKGSYNSKYGITVNFKEKAAPVSVYHKDFNTNEDLINPEILNGNIGDGYSSTQKDISNYTLKSVEGNAEGEFTSEQQIVTYYYEKNNDTNSTGDDNSDTKSTLESDSDMDIPTTGNNYLFISFVTMFMVAITLVSYRKILEKK